MQLTDRIAIITGAASGLGASTASLLSAHGVKCALVDFQEEKLKEVAAATNSNYFVCDITKPEKVKNTFEAIQEKYSAIHVLVNCAGVANGERIVGREGPMPLENFERVIRINLLGAFDMMRLAANQMAAQEVVNDDGERGVIINVSSVAAFDGQLGQAAYSASKGGVAVMTLPAARELGKFGIRVMAIAPGVMQTPMVDGLKQEIIASIVEKVPFPKRFGKPEEFALLVQHIIENTLLNAEVIRMDGGVRLA